MSYNAHHHQSILNAGRLNSLSLWTLAYSIKKLTGKLRLVCSLASPYFQPKRQNLSDKSGQMNSDMLFIKSKS